MRIIAPLLALLGACADDPSGDTPSDDTDAAETDWARGDDTDGTFADDTDAKGGFGVGQGGAQDFGAFKQILEAGQLPAASTLDDVGFFAEHVIGQPPPDCGQRVCLHARFGSLGNMINGTDCNILLLGFNTPINPAAEPRPPLDLVFVVDTSVSMRGDPIDHVREGLLRALDPLEAGDVVSLVTFNDEGTLVLDGVDATDPALPAAIEAITVRASTNLHDGLRVGYDAAARHAAPGMQQRVLLLSDGVPNEGVVDPDAILALTEAAATAGTTTTTIGLGARFDPVLLRNLANVGAGAFYFVEDEAAVEEVFEEELAWFLLPLARAGAVEIDVGGGFVPANTYGTHTFTVSPTSVSIDIPTLQIAHRPTNPTPDDPTARRGGGGAILVELLRDAGPTAGDLAATRFRYTDAVTGEVVEQDVRTSLPGDPVDPEVGHFDDQQVEKSFVMLNLYVGFRQAAQHVEAGRVDLATATLQALRDNVAAWTARHPDADIVDDLRYVDLFLANLAAATPPGDTDDAPVDSDWLWD